MARSAKKKDDTEVTEVKTMDFERVKSLYIKDIKPGRTQASSHGQAVAEAFKTIKKHCHVEPQGARKAFSAFEMEEAMREVHIRSFVGVFNTLIGREVLTCNFGDLVDQAEGKAPVQAPAPRPNLVVVSDGSETDLTDAADTDPRDLDLTGDGAFEEATAEELERQEGRGKAGKGKPH